MKSLLKGVMKNNKIIFGLFLLLNVLGSWKAKAQLPYYECHVSNINQISPNELTFDIMLSNTSTVAFNLQAFQIGIEFNYAGMANGGTITQSWVPGSSIELLPVGFQDLSAQGAQILGPSLIGSNYKQVRLTAKTGISSTNAIPLTSIPKKYCTMKLTNTVPFTPGVAPNFIWSFKNSSGRTRTALSAFVNGNTTGVLLTTQITGGTPNASTPAAAYNYIAGPQHFVDGNPILNPIVCPIASLGTISNPVCYGGAGTTIINLSSAFSGTYTVNGGSPQAFISGTSFTIGGLLANNYTITITPTGCTPTTLSFVITQPNQLTNSTTVAACNNYTWSVNNQTYTTSGTYTETTLNANGCMVTETLNLTINPVPNIISISPNPACANTPITVTTNGATQVQWQLNGNTLYSSSTFQTIPSTSGVTVAGGNGAGSGANQLNHPYSIIFNAESNLLISDMSNHRIQKWVLGSTNGITVAGGNGIGTASNQLNTQAGILLDANNNLYIADRFNHRIQKWQPGAASGSTVAGSTIGNSSPQFANPRSIVMDANGDLYVAEDFNNHRILKTTPGSGVYTVAAGGNGVGNGTNQLSEPIGVRLNSNGDLIITDRNNLRIQKWVLGATSGTTIAGGLVSGMYPLLSPSSTCFDANGNLYIADAGHHRILKWLPGTSSFITVAGGNGQGYGANQLNYPSEVIIDNNNNLYIADFANHRIQKWTQNETSTFTPTQSGTYTVIVSNAAGCTTSQTITVTQPNVSASNESGIIGSSIALNATPNGGTFSVANPYSNSIAGVYPYTYTYTDPVTGCSATASANITITDPNTTTLCLVSSKDAMLHENNPNTNYGSNINQSASRWTYGGSNWRSTHSLFEFDLSSIPACATITSATLTLRLCNTCSAASYADKHYDLANTNGNAGIIEAVTSPWTENTVSWSTAPSITSTNAVSIPSMGNASTADIVSNITAMVQNMVSTGNNNGFQIRLANNGNYYHNLNFATRENPNPAIRPELCITYTTSNYFVGLGNDVCNCAAVSVSACDPSPGYYSGSGITNTGNNTATYNPCNVGSSGTVQFTISGNYTSYNHQMDVRSHTMFIKSDKSLWGWGANNYGQTGTNTTATQWVPVLIDNTRQWKAVSNGTNFTVAIDMNGDMYSCGGNDYYQLGDGTTTYRYTLTPIGLGHIWRTVSCGNAHSVAITTNGEIFGWGRNVLHHLGLSPALDVSIPTQIGNDADWKDVSCGGQHTLFLKHNGMLYQSGSLPLGLYASPSLVNNDNDWIWIQAGATSCHALKANQKMYAWGGNAFGQIGNGGTSNVLIPTQIGSANWRNIHINDYSAVGVQSDGTLYTWGYNGYGQLSNNTTTNILSPYAVGGADWGYGIGGFVNCIFVKQNGDMYICGKNSGGELGLGLGVPDAHQYVPLNINIGAVTADQVFNKTVTIHPCNPSLSIKLFIEGYYTGSSTMQPVLMNQGIGNSTTLCDDISIALHSDAAPYNLVASSNASINTDGVITANFSGVLPGNYYIVAKHRNALETWSSVPVAITTSGNYDFSTSDGQAFSSNQKNVEAGIWALYSGDINQDATTDAFDYLLLDPDIVAGSSGYYVTDLNGDGVVDAFDYLVLDPNITAGVGVQKP